MHFVRIVLLYVEIFIKCKLEVLSFAVLRGHLYIMLGHRSGWVVQKMTIFPYFYFY